MHFRSSGDPRVASPSCDSLYCMVAVLDSTAASSMPCCGMRLPSISESTWASRASPLARTWPTRRASKLTSSPSSPLRAVRSTLGKAAARSDPTVGACPGGPVWWPAGCSAPGATMPPRAKLLINCAMASLFGEVPPSALLMRGAPGRPRIIAAGCASSACSCLASRSSANKSACDCAGCGRGADPSLAAPRPLNSWGSECKIRWTRSCFSTHPEVLMPHS
mmetsp:Transcript_62704/g.202248  ORF Transcript_62704/g.202248 Transcript_62704/m.202248 type:complete len:221 (+) Transcript_62704:218-880(+)